MHLHVRFKDEAQFSVRNLKNLGTCLRGLRNHYQYYVPLALNIIRAKRVSNCYMQGKKTDRLCVSGCSANVGFSVEKLSWF